MNHYLTPEEHVADILRNSKLATLKKYKSGQEEHGGRLWRKPIMDYLEDEIVDMTVYWFTLKQQWEDLFLLLYGIQLHEECTPLIKKRINECLNLMAYGNREGEEEEERNG